MLNHQDKELIELRLLGCIFFGMNIQGGHMSNQGGLERSTETRGGQLPDLVR